MWKKKMGGRDAKIFCHSSRPRVPVHGRDVEPDPVTH